MTTTMIPTPKASVSTVWRRRVRDGHRPNDERATSIMHAHENSDYSALLRDLKLRTVWDDGCWIWLGQVKPDGSAWVNLRARAVRVRRLVSEAFIGAPLDSRDKIFSTCGVVGCVNPEHLEIRTYVR